MLQMLFPAFFRPKDELSAIDRMSSPNASLFEKSGVGSSIIEGNYVQNSYLWRTAFFVLLALFVFSSVMDRLSLRQAISTGGNHTYAVPVDHDGAATAKGALVPVAGDAATAEKHRILRLLVKSATRGGPDGTVVTEDQNVRDSLCVGACTDFFARWYSRNDGQNAQLRRNPLHVRIEGISDIGRGATNTFDVRFTLEETEASTGRVIRTEPHAVAMTTTIDPAHVSSDNAWAVVVNYVKEDDVQQ